MNQAKKIQSPLAEMYYDNGILFVEFLAKENITLEDAKTHTDLRDQYFSSYYPLLTLVDVGNTKQMNKEARSHLINAETAEKTKANAIIIISGPGRIAGNLFLQFFKTKYPIKIFNDRVKAIEWLNTHK